MGSNSVDNWVNSGGRFAYSDIGSVCKHGNKGYTGSSSYYDANNSNTSSQSVTSRNSYRSSNPQSGYGAYGDTVRGFKPTYNAGILPGVQNMYNRIEAYGYYDIGIKR